MVWRHDLWFISEIFIALQNLSPHINDSMSNNWAWTVAIYFTSYYNNSEPLTMIYYLIVGNFRGRKLSRISRFYGYSQKFSPWNFGRGVIWHGTSEQSAKVFSLKSFPLYGMCSETLTKLWTILLKMRTCTAWVSWQAVACNLTKIIRTCTAQNCYCNVLMRLISTLCISLADVTSVLMKVVTAVSKQDFEQCMSE